MNLIKKYKDKYVEFGLGALLLIQFLLICVCNLTLIDNNLDCDNAKMFRHIMEIWERKTLVIPDWSYTTTLEIDCGSLLAIPIYGLTDNIYLAYGIANILITVLMLAVIFYLFKDKEFRYPLLCANFICIPYRLGMLDYFNMMLFAGTQYIIKVMVPLLLVGIVLDVETQNKHRQKLHRLTVCAIAVYVFLLFITCMSSSVYVMACGIVPVCIAYGVYKFFKYEKVPVSLIVLLLISGLCLVVGNHINVSIMGGTRGNSMVFCSVYQMLANISSCFFGMFELFGGATTSFELQIFTLKGVLSVAKISLVLLMLVCAIWNITKALKGKAQLREILLLGIFVWNYFILNVANVRAGSATYEFRYHLIGMIPLMCLTVITLVQGIKTLRAEQQKWLWGMAGLVIVFLLAGSYKEVFESGEKNAELKELTAYCKKLDLDYIYMFMGSNDSDICRVLDDSALYMHLGENGKTWIYDYYNYYIDAFPETERSIVVVNDEAYATGDTFAIQEHTLTRFATVGGRSLYYFN